MSPIPDPPEIRGAGIAGEIIRPEVADYIRRQGGVLRSLLEGGLNETDLLILAERLKPLSRLTEEDVRRIVRDELLQLAARGQVLS